MNEEGAPEWQERAEGWQSAANRKVFQHLAPYKVPELIQSAVRTIAFEIPMCIGSSQMTSW